MQATGDALAILTADTEGKRRGESENFQRVNAMYTTLDHHKSHARQFNACATCARSFADETELGAFLHKQVKTERTSASTECSICLSERSKFSNEIHIVFMGCFIG